MSNNTPFSSRTYIALLRLVRIDIDDGEVYPNEVVNDIPIAKGDPLAWSIWGEYAEEGIFMISCQA